MKIIDVRVVNSDHVNSSTALIEVVTDAHNYSIIETPPEMKDGYLEVSSGSGLGLGNFVHESISGLNT